MTHLAPLSMPSAGPDDDHGFAELLAKITRDRGFACASYKDKCLRRRIGVRLRARGVASYEDYAALLDADAGEYDRLLDTLTINVTKLFRNWGTFAAIQRTIIPALWARGDAALNVWSAGCASGEEAYSLAVLLHHHAATAGASEHRHRIRVLGTDIDRDSLTRLRAPPMAQRLSATRHRICGRPISPPGGRRPSIRRCGRSSTSSATMSFATRPRPNST